MVTLNYCFTNIIISVKFNNLTFLGSYECIYFFIQICTQPWNNFNSTLYKNVIIILMVKNCIHVGLYSKVLCCVIWNDMSWFTQGVLRNTSASKSCIIIFKISSVHFFSTYIIINYMLLFYFFFKYEKFCIILNLNLIYDLNMNK